ncbi:hypothetical protein VPNG_02379 [Cytospora leucostoma]|uniref:Uncharacterized protein n=1 Tax=Cytospora leucostoma TaxID=1230097 RepID=A0A423XGG0_9PEZI|nr:hypothetical protein VPNG_02379 [Cytospora leucostoma]
MRCSILLIAVMASSGLTAPTPGAGGSTQLSPATKRTMGERGLHYADVPADDDAILYRWQNLSGGAVESEKDTDSEEVADEAQA